jgi:hypothetical protein
MKILLLLLLLSTAYAEPSSRCNEDFNACTIADFQIDNNDVQCVPNAVDINGEVLMRTVGQAQRVQCPLYSWCVPHGEKRFGPFDGSLGYEVKVSGRKFIQKSGQTTSVTSMTVSGPGSENNEAFNNIVKNYYNNQDHCVVSYLGILFWLLMLLIVAAIVYVLYRIIWSPTNTKSSRRYNEFKLFEQRKKRKFDDFTGI